jgi:phage/plasmid-like protein (TIGR03299 family)
MAHEIDQTTGRPAVFTVGQLPWHGLGANVKDAPDSRRALELAGLDWHVEQWPLYVRSPGDGELLAASGHRANVRTDTQRLLGVVGDRYRVFQNAECFQFADALAGEGHARYESAGALREGRQAWLLMRLPRDLHVGPEDELRNYVLLTNSFDGGSTLRVMLTSVRVVCSNTLRLALRSGGSDGLSIPHRGNLQDRLEQARRALGLIDRRLTQFQQRIDVLRGYAMTGDRLQRYLDAALPPPGRQADNEARLQHQRQQSRVVELFMNDRNRLPGIAGTAWGALNALTEFADHELRVRGRDERQRAERRLSSIWWGRGDELKQRASRAIDELVGLN